MRVIIFTLALTLLGALAQAEYVTIVPVVSHAAVQNTNVAETYGKSVTVRFWSLAKNEISAAMNNTNINAGNSLLGTPDSVGQNQLFGFYLNAQRQPGCDVSFSQDPNELELQNAVKVQAAPEPTIVLRSEALVAQLLQNLPASNEDIDSEYAALPQTLSSGVEESNENLLAIDSSASDDSSILNANSGKSILDSLLSSRQGENSLEHNAPASLESVILASAMGGTGVGGNLSEASEVPEPASIVLLLAGMTGLYWIRRKSFAKR